MFRRRLDPGRWSIPARSAAVSAAVVLAALVVATGVVLAVLHGLLLSGVDEAADARVIDIARALQDEQLDAFAEELIATDERIAAVQIIDSGGLVVQHSPGTAMTPLLPPDSFGPHVTHGIPVAKMRLSGETVDTPTGTYTVLVGGATEAASQTVRTVLILLLALAPLVVAEAAFVNFRLVKRSLRSVDAIRARVSAISSSDLSERVPVPPSRDEIASLAVTMNAMLERIEKGHRAQQQFVGDASHELRSPLTTVLSTLEVVEMHPHLLTGELISDTLLPEAHRMRELLDDLLLLARADEKRLVLRRDAVQLDDLVNAEALRLRGGRPPTLEVDLQPVCVPGDGSALARMIRNLLDNAARYASTRVEIRLRTVGAGAELIIADDGPGIPESQRHRIFDRFVRLESDRSRQSGGTGLGVGDCRRDRTWPPGHRCHQ